MAETIAKNVAVFGDHEPNTLAQLHDVASRAERAALMADGHQGYVMPIGGVAAYTEQVSVVVGRKNRSGDAPVDHDLFRSDAWNALPHHAREGLRSKARSQLGTVGS